MGSPSPLRAGGFAADDSRCELTATGSLSFVRSFVRRPPSSSSGLANRESRLAGAQVRQASPSSRNRKQLSHSLSLCVCVCVRLCRKSCACAYLCVSSAAQIRPAANMCVCVCVMSQGGRRAVSMNLCGSLEGKNYSHAILPATRSPERVAKQEGDRVGRPVFSLPGWPPSLQLISSLGQTNSQVEREEEESLRYWASRDTVGAKSSVPFVAIALTHISLRKMRARARFEPRSRIKRTDQDS